MKVYPDLGKQIIKFDLDSQTIKVADYNPMYRGNYTVTLTIIHNQIVRKLEFEVAFWGEDQKSWFYFDVSEMIDLNET
jgi:hypothetical protein